MEKEKTDFGFDQIDITDKAERVGRIFDSVADRYDLMNDLMSLGIHRLWKRFGVVLTGARRGDRVLDLAGGTGDLAWHLTRAVGPRGFIVLADINASMLARGRQRLTDLGVVGNLDYLQADAESLPFPDNHFDRVTIAFGLRNVTRKENALASMYRVLKPGGTAVVLEFSRLMVSELRPGYDFYSLKVLPLLGKLVVDDADSYRYLAESIRVHPDQRTLLGMMEQVGFERCDFFNLTGGLVAAHRGYKF
jgi:demethylmenaquinone methyltransferase/2-methoxy-6-polyprenyl-1,4-benzoquinol methylase